MPTSSTSPEKYVIAVTSPGDDGHSASACGILLLNVSERLNRLRAILSAPVRSWRTSGRSSLALPDELVNLSESSC